MKSNKDFAKNLASPDTLRRAAKLDPIKRSGKERHQLYKSLNDGQSEDEQEEDFRPVRESVLDYMDPEGDE